MFTNLVMSGGAHKGLAYIGCLKYLEETNKLKFIKNIIGSSVGALIGFLVCLKFTNVEIQDFAEKTFTTFAKTEFDIEHLLAMYAKLGMEDANSIVDFFRRAAIKRDVTEDITFIEFAKKTGMNFVVCGSNLSTAKTEYFCVNKTPDMSVFKALEISIALPLVFKPIMHNDMLYVDAGLFSNLPIEYFNNAKRPFTDTIVLNIQSDYKPNVTDLNILSYIKVVVDACFERMNSKPEETASKHNVNVIISIKDDDCFGFDFKTLRLRTVENANLFVDIGYEEIKAALESRESVLD
jgi:NTE family protein